MNEKEFEVIKSDFTQTSSSVGKNRFRKILQSLMIFLLASAVACVLIPSLSQSIGLNDEIKGHAIPSLMQISLTGVVLIILTSVLLKSITKILGLTNAWLILAICYSVACIGIEFIILPFSMYNHSYDTGAFLGVNPNHISTIIELMLAMALVGFLLYLIFFKIHNRKSGDVLKSKSISAPLVATVGVIIATVLMFGKDILFFLLFFFGLPALEIIPNIFSNLALSIAFILASGLTLIALDGSSRELSRISTKSNDSTLLASVYWLSVVLIVAYNILWVVFMIAMISIWKFDTFQTSEGL